MSPSKPITLTGSYVVGCLMMFFGSLGLLVVLTLIGAALTNEVGEPPKLSPQIPAALLKMNRSGDSIHYATKNDCLVVSDLPKTFRVSFETLNTLEGDWTGSDTAVEFEGKAIPGVPASTKPLKAVYLSKPEITDEGKSAFIDASFEFADGTLPLGKVSNAVATMTIKYPRRSLPGQFTIVRKDCSLGFSICRLDKACVESLSQYETYLSRKAERERLPAYFKSLGVAACVIIVGAIGWYVEHRKMQGT